MNNELGVDSKLLLNFMKEFSFFVKFYLERWEIKFGVLVLKVFFFFDKKNLGIRASIRSELTYIFGVINNLEKNIFVFNLENLDIS